MADLLEVVDLLTTGLGNGSPERGQRRAPPLRRTVLVRHWPIIVPLWAALTAVGLAGWVSRASLIALGNRIAVPLAVAYLLAAASLLWLSMRESRAQPAEGRGRAARRRRAKASRHADRAPGA